MNETGIFQDWKANKRNPKIQLALAAFRLAQRVSRAPKPYRCLGVPVLVLYRVLVEWFFGIELHWSLNVGPRLRIYHGRGLVVHASSRIGADCVLRHTTTLGTKSSATDAPVLGDRVDVGAHVVIIGPVLIGDDAVIGAGSVVTRDVVAHSVVAGNPAHELGRNLREA